jgi:hypothetical protein
MLDNFAKLMRLGVVADLTAVHHVLKLDCERHQPCHTRNARDARRLGFRRDLAHLLHAPVLSHRDHNLDLDARVPDR